MSPITLIAGVAMLVSACGQAGEQDDGQDHTPLGQILWARADLYQGRPISLKSPSQLLKLDYDGNGVIVSDRSGRIIKLDVEPPASIIWRPDGNGVAINNGNGSGQMSDLILVRDGPSITDGVQGQLVSYFFKHTGCRVDPAAVSVSAEGWSTDNSSLWVRFESWDRRTFCDDRPVSFAQYDLKRHAVVSHLSSSAALDKFCRDADFRQLFGPNCERHKVGLQ